MRQRGFTIIELVITLAIVGLLAMAAMPLAQLVAKREKEAELRTALRDIRGALDAYKLAAQGGHIKLELGASGYPPDLKSLYAGVEDATSEKKKNLYFLRRLPRPVLSRSLGGGRGDLGSAQLPEPARRPAAGR